MAVGTPVLGMECKRFSSLFTREVYKQMNIENPPIASTPEEYIEICKKLAFDNDYRKRLSRQIYEKSREKLFNDGTIYKEYIEFFNAAIYEAKNGSFLPYNWKCSLEK